MSERDSERDEIQANIDAIRVEIEKLQALVDREQERMAMLPKPARRVYEA